MHMARRHSGQRDKDKAFAEVNRAYENHDSRLPMMKMDMRMDQLPDDRRFRELLSRVGFSQ